MVKATPIKRRNIEKSKESILNAATSLFAELGYAQTSIREIAKAANVSPALPVVHFGSKAELFEAALHSALNFDTVMSTKKKAFGKNIVKNLFDPAMPVLLPAMISLSIGDPEASKITVQFVKQHMIPSFAEWLGPPHAQERAQLIVSIGTGIGIFNRALLGNESHTESSSIPVWMANVIQDLVDGDEAVIDQLLAIKPHR